MTEDEKLQLKDSINSKIIELGEELVLLQESIKPISPDSAYGRVSRMDAINNQVVAKASYNDKDTMIKRLKFVMTKIDEPEYGFCVRCQDEIPFGRVKSIPYSNLCIKCAQKG